MSAAFDRILEHIQDLTPDELQRLRRLLADESRASQAQKSIEQLATEQGTRPIDFDQLLGDFWPEDEDVDEFIATVREWRREGKSRSGP